MRGTVAESGSGLSPTSSTHVATVTEAHDRVDVPLVIQTSAGMPEPDLRQVQDRGGVLQKGRGCTYPSIHDRGKFRLIGPLSVVVPRKGD